MATARRRRAARADRCPGRARGSGRCRGRSARGGRLPVRWPPCAERPTARSSASHPAREHGRPRRPPPHASAVPPGNRRGRYGAERACAGSYAPRIVGGDRYVVGVILLLSTSDTDLLSARASGAGYRLANPARTGVDDLPALVDGVDIVLVRILGGRRAWEDGLDALLAGSRPVV